MIKIVYDGIYEAPARQTKHSAGIDLFNNTRESIIIQAGESAIIPTGLKVAIPHGYVGIVASRSSLAFKFDCTLANGIGVIDSDYRGEVKAKVVNLSKSQSHTIEPGERIAQLVIIPCLMDQYIQVESLDETERGDRGCGSTGRV